MNVFARLRPDPAMLVALLALVVVSAGSATAASMITSAQIKDHTIQVKDLNKKTVRALKGKTGPRGAAGAQGEQGTAGPQGDQGAQGEKGDPGTARGWAFITPAGVVQSHRGTFDNLAITHPATGVYCLGTVAGTSNGLGNYDAVLATAHGQDFAKLVVSINTEYGSQCNPYGGHSAYVTNLAGTPMDAYFVVALL